MHPFRRLWGAYVVFASQQQILLEVKTALLLDTTNVPTHINSKTKVSNKQ
jgi:hypothetical protein